MTSDTLVKGRELITVMKVRNIYKLCNFVLYEEGSLKR